MLANSSPLVILLIGVIIGWLLEWFFDLWFFRRNRLEAERRLESVEAQRASMEARAKAAELRASELEQQVGQTAAALAVADAARDAGAQADVVAAEDLGAEAVLVGEVIEPEDTVMVTDAEVTDVVATEAVVTEVVADETITEDDVEVAEIAAPVSADAWPPGTAPATAAEAPADVEVVEEEPIGERDESAPSDEPEAVALDQEVTEADAAEVSDSEIEAAPVDGDAWPPASEEK